MNTSSLLWGVLFGSIGLGYSMYGKKQGRYATLLSGLGLMIYPYFVSNTLLLVAVGAGLVAVPFFIKS